MGILIKLYREMTETFIPKRRVLNPDEIIGGCYRVVSLIGSGGMAEVYDVVHLQLGEHFAMKVFTLAEGDVAYLREHFTVEGRLLARLRHRHVVRVIDLGEIEQIGCAYFIMDLITLPMAFAQELQRNPSALLKKRHEANQKRGAVMTLAVLLRSCGHLPYPVVRYLFRDICLGLGYVHSMGVIHRDLKLENVLLDAEGRAVLADFGIAKIINPSLQRAFSDKETLLNTSVGKRVAGSHFYLAPELLAGDAATVKSDIYALGVMLYRLLTGNWYEGGGYFFSKLDALPATWAKPLRRMLAQSPDYRAGAISEIMALLPSQGEFSTVIFTRRRCLALVGGVFLAGAGGGIYRWGKNQPKPVSAPAKPVMEFETDADGTILLSSTLNEKMILRKRGEFSLEIEPDAKGKVEIILERDPPKNLTFLPGAHAQVQLHFEVPTNLSAMKATVSESCQLILTGMIGAHSPSAELAPNSSIIFEGNDKTELTLSALAAPDTAKIIVRGQGATFFPDPSEKLLLGVVYVEDGATLHIQHATYKGSFGVEVFDGSRLTFASRTNREWRRCVRFIRLREGGAMVIAEAKRQMIGGCPWELWDRARIETKSSIVAYGHTISAHSGICTIEDTSEWSPILLGGAAPFTLHTEKGAELMVKISICSYDYYGGAPIQKTGPGRVTFQSKRLQTITTFSIKEGSVCLLSMWVQNTESYFEKPHITRCWHVEKDASILGTGGIEFRRSAEKEQPEHPFLEIQSGGILEGGVEGEGLFSVSHLNLQDGSIIRVVSPKEKSGQGFIEAGLLMQHKPATVWIDLSRWSIPHSSARHIPIITWSEREGEKPVFSILPNLTDKRKEWKLVQTETEVYLQHD